MTDIKAKFRGQGMEVQFCSTCMCYRPQFCAYSVFNQGSLHSVTRHLWSVLQTSSVWRSQSALKLDRRKGQSRALSRRSSTGLIERYVYGLPFGNQQPSGNCECEFDLIIMSYKLNCNISCERLYQCLYQVVHCSTLVLGQDMQNKPTVVDHIVFCLSRSEAEM